MTEVFKIMNGWNGTGGEGRERRGGKGREGEGEEERERRVPKVTPPPLKNPRSATAKTLILGVIT